MASHSLALVEYHQVFQGEKTLGSEKSYRRNQYDDEQQRELRGRMNSAHFA